MTVSISLILQSASLIASGIVITHLVRKHTRFINRGRCTSNAVSAVSNLGNLKNGMSGAGGDTIVANTVNKTDIRNLIGSNVVNSAVSRFTRDYPRKRTIFSNMLMKKTSTATKLRISGTIKILLSNLSSLIYSTVSLITLSTMNETGTTLSESGGWAQFFVLSLLPVLTATINPLIFMSLTPGSVARLKDYVYGEVVRGAKEQGVGEVRWERCRSRRRRHCSRVTRVSKVTKVR